MFFTIKRSLLTGTHKIQHRNSTVESRYPALSEPIGLASPFCQLRGTLVFDSQLTEGEIAPTRQLPPYLQQPIFPKTCQSQEKKTRLERVLPAVHKRGSCKSHPTVSPRPVIGLSLNTIHWSATLGRKNGNARAVLKLLVCTL